MNISNKKTYNNQEYDVSLFMYSSNVTLTSPSAIETNDKDSMLIPTESITYIMIENSIVDIIPIAEFEIIDNGFLLTSKLKKENFRFRLIISKGNSRTSN